MSRTLNPSRPHWMDTPPDYRARFIQRFHAKYTKGAAQECWHWEGAISGARGYGLLRGGFRTRAMHVVSRVALELSLGRKLRDGFYACHTCDSRSCVNPAHLFEGTPSDNTRDMYRKGRGRHAGKTHCVNGHERTEENTLREDGGVRRCRTCRMAEYEERARKRHEAQRARRAA